ncbi:hypothetical protein [Acinetobacter sp. ANC 3791]|uniref:hypothetical protein n=1 Tax=Acinetobacter sp. ANC 3791 TaxID=2529836 RepID=UPI00103AC79C|nr:hypothetical protein [Acinetobacter sp. ANC 3791]TCB83177.1 hypothetical protein E0H90_12770 [Acinetobacter sp. ANC 3791]
MNVLDIKTSIYENFSDFHFSKNFTLAESDFYDTFSKSFAEYSKDKLYVELREYYNDDIAHFIIRNMVENKYIEPFESWSEIPLWYYNAFSFGGFINLNSHNLIYYLSGFMYVILSNNIDFNSNASILRWYDILNLTSYYVDEYLSKELNHNQLKTIALFLCYDPETEEIDLSPPSADDDSIFAKFWYSFLK